MTDAYSTWDDTLQSPRDAGWDKTHLQHRQLMLAVVVRELARSEAGKWLQGCVIH